MNKIERKLEKINGKLASRVIENTARQVGFIMRERKIQAVNFIKTFCLITFYKACSLSICAEAFGFISKNLISKQGISKRLTVECVEFFRTLLFVIIAEQSTFKEASSKGMFSHFTRVLLEDSTNISLPEKLAGIFPGSKNQSNKPNAIMKLQSIYNLLSEKFISFKLTPYTYNEQKASSDIVSLFRASNWPESRGKLFLKLTFY